MMSCNAENSSSWSREQLKPITSTNAFESDNSNTEKYNLNNAMALNQWTYFPSDETKNKRKTNLSPAMRDAKKETLTWDSTGRDLNKRSTMKDLMLFKDDFLQALKNWEKDLTTKNSSLISDLEKKVNDSQERISSLWNDHRAIKEYASLDKTKLDRIDEIILKQVKCGDSIITLQVKLDNCWKDLNKACYKYDKLVLDNLQVPTIVGDFCKYKNWKEYIVDTLDRITAWTTCRDKNEMDLQIYQTKIENLITQFKYQMEYFKINANDYTDSRVRKCEENSKDYHDNLKAFIETLRWENSKYAASVKEETEKLKSETWKIIDIKNEIQEKMEETIRETEVIKKDVIDEFQIIRKEFKDVKWNVLELAKFLSRNCDKTASNSQGNKGKNSAFNNWFDTTEIKDQIINNFNNTLINLIRDLAKEEQAILVQSWKEKMIMNTNKIIEDTASTIIANAKRELNTRKPRNSLLGNEVINTNNSWSNENTSRNNRNINQKSIWTIGKSHESTSNKNIENAESYVKKYISGDLGVEDLNPKRRQSVMNASIQKSLHSVMMTIHNKDLASNASINTYSASKEDLNHDYWKDKRKRNSQVINSNNNNHNNVNCKNVRNSLRNAIENKNWKQWDNEDIRNVISQKYNKDNWTSERYENQGESSRVIEPQVTKNNNNNTKCKGDEISEVDNNNNIGEEEKYPTKKGNIATDCSKHEREIKNDITMINNNSSSNNCVKNKQQFPENFNTIPENDYSNCKQNNWNTWLINDPAYPLDQQVPVYHNKKSKNLSINANKFNSANTKTIYKSTQNIFGSSQINNTNISSNAWTENEANLLESPHMPNIPISSIQQSNLILSHRQKSSRLSNTKTFQQSICYWANKNRLISYKNQYIPTYKNQLNSNTQVTLPQYVKNNIENNILSLDEEDKLFDDAWWKTQQFFKDSSKSPLENKILEIEFFTKKRFDELVSEIKNYLPIHFNSHIKNYSVIEQRFDQQFIDKITQNRLNSGYRREWEGFRSSSHNTWIKNKGNNRKNETNKWKKPFQLNNVKNMDLSNGKVKNDRQSDEHSGLRSHKNIFSSQPWTPPANPSYIAWSKYLTNWPRDEIDSDDIVLLKDNN